MSSVAASASVAVRSLVRGEPVEVAVLGAFARAVYLAVDGWSTPTVPSVLALVTVDGVAQPNAVALTGTAAARPLTRHHIGQRGVVGGGRVVLGGRAYVPRRWWDPVPRLRPTSVAALRRAVGAVERAATAVAAPSLPPELAAPLDAVARGLRDRDASVAATHARSLLGRGAGLTPAGDDAFAGLASGILLLVRAVGEPAWHDREATLTATTTETASVTAGAASGRTTSVSAALLHHAARGEVADPAAQLLRGLTGHGDVAVATRRLLAVGSTSGADLLAGLLAAARVVADDVDATSAHDGHATPVPTTRST